MEMIVSTDITTLVARRNAIAKEIEAARDAVARAEQLYKESPVGYYDYVGSEKRQTKFCRLAGYDSGIDAGVFNRQIKGFDCEAWDYLMANSGIASLMSTKAKDKWEKQRKELDIPEFTMENIQTTFGELHARRTIMFEEGVIEAFRACSWDHKTNNPVKFGKKIIVAGCRYGFDTSHYRHVDDLRRVLHVCDGKPQPDCRNGVLATMAYRNKLRHFEDDYVKVEGFKNGNLHCSFKCPDLVEELNLILSRHFPGALPAPK
ncbi:MAG: DUF4942 domain-containing protein [Betaproteobacteria bacterium]